MDTKWKKWINSGLIAAVIIAMVGGVLFGIYQMHTMDNYNDGRRKTFYSIAVNLLELQDIREVMEHIKTEINPENTGKEKAAAAAGYFQTAADRKGVVLKLRKKPSTPSGQKQKDTE